MRDQNDETIMCMDDVLNMLDTLLEREDRQFWDEFWKDKEKPIPFFVDLPDENLIQYLNKDMITVGKVIDVGCGNGRNSRYLASKGFEVEAIDYSKESIEWAVEATGTEYDIDYIHASVFDIKKSQGDYDFIYDSGCLHHIKPHRRPQYLKKMCTLLKPGGYFGLVCFNASGATTFSDHDIYNQTCLVGWAIQKKNLRRYWFRFLK